MKKIAWILCFCCIAFASYANEPDFVPLNPEDALLLDTSEGQVLIQLAPQFAPKHVAQVKKLVRQGVYDNRSFYRVIEGFVAQGGTEGDESVEAENLKLEAEFSLDKFPFTLVQHRDLFAPNTGFSHGFAVAATLDKSTGWLAHCPGVVALARGTEADTGSTDFYINIGQAPRYLDRIMSVFGKVVWGMDVVQRIRRAQPGAPGGVIEDESKRTKIISAKILSDLETNPYQALLLENTHSDAFKEKLVSRRERAHPFFLGKVPPVLDICQVPLTVKMAASE